MATYVREGRKRKWHEARETGRALLPRELIPVLCNRTIRAREFTPDRHETDRTGLCYQCGRKESQRNE